MDRKKQLTVNILIYIDDKRLVTDVLRHDRINTKTSM